MTKPLDQRLREVASLPLVATLSVILVVCVVGWSHPQTQMFYTSPSTSVPTSQAVPTHPVVKPAPMTPSARFATTQPGNDAQYQLSEGPLMTTDQEIAQSDAHFQGLPLRRFFMAAGAVLAGIVLALRSGRGRNGSSSVLDPLDLQSVAPSANWAMATSAGDLEEQRTRLVRKPEGTPKAKKWCSNWGTTVTVMPRSYGMNSFFFPMYGYGMGGYGGYSYFGFTSFFNLIFLATMAYFVISFVQGGTNTASVTKLQIGLLGLARNLQKDLEGIATKADTNSPDGLHFVLQETVMSLLRNPEYCVYGYSTGMQGLNIDRTEDRFNQESMNERGKFKAETLVNFGGVSKAGPSGQASDDTNELILVTLLVASEGDLRLPQVNDAGSLRDALQKLGGVRRDGLLAVEVLWTPQEDGDTFTQEELARDYPVLNRL